MNLLEKIYEASERLHNVVVHTPLLKNTSLSQQYQANVLLKREDLQVVRSYKIRGAYNKISQLTEEQKSVGVVCASAGNHAQGVAFACSELGITGTIFMPSTTPKQKIAQVKSFGGKQIAILLIGDTFDDAQVAAHSFCNEQAATFVHPFDDLEVIAGQGTVGLEILENADNPIDYIFVPIGGGGLAAGICTIVQELSPTTKIIGVEPMGAPSMWTSLQAKEIKTLDTIDRFIDGAAVKRVGDQNFEFCRNVLHDVILVPEGKVCSTILKLYNEEAMVVEPAGALTISALDLFDPNKLKDKNVVCVVSGSNNDILRTEEIKERSLLFEGLKHYFMIEFPQRPGALKTFVSDVLGDSDDITYFQFSKKTNKESGPAIVGIELKDKSDFRQLEKQMNAGGFNFTYLNENPMLFAQLIG